jgi:hypothetical protein
MKTPRSSRTGSGDPRAKVSLRLPQGTAAMLAKRAKAAGLSRGDYFASVLEGMPAPPLPLDHTECLEALGLSTDGLAVVARDLSELTRLNGEESMSAIVDGFFGRLSADNAVTTHLRMASQLLSALRAEAAQRLRALRPTRGDSEA